MLARTAADRLVYEPGKGWGYSNIGYYFVRRLIEQTTDHALGDALDHLVLKPLGIAGVRFAADRAHYSPELRSALGLSRIAGRADCSRPHCCCNVC